MNTGQNDPSAARPEIGPSYPPPGQAPYGPSPYGPPPPAPAPGAAEPRLKSPGLAGLLSFLLPGLGHVYVGYYQRGITIALVFAALITTISSGLLDGLEPLLGIAIGFTVLFNIIDANRLAHFYNRALQGGGAAELPDLQGLPRDRGSVAGGAVLVVLGALMLLNRLFDFSLEWVADWWPVGVIVLGVWLIVRARRESAASRES